MTCNLDAPVEFHFIVECLTMCWWSSYQFGLECYSVDWHHLSRPIVGHNQRGVQHSLTVYVHITFCEQFNKHIPMLPVCQVKDKPIALQISKQSKVIENQLFSFTNSEVVFLPTSNIIHRKIVMFLMSALTSL
jgi:hypothetical protein